MQQLGTTHLAITIRVEGILRRPPTTAPSSQTTITGRFILKGSTAAQASHWLRWTEGAASNSLHHHLLGGVTLRLASRPTRERFSPCAADDRDTSPTSSVPSLYLCTAGVVVRNIIVAAWRIDEGFEPGAWLAARRQGGTHAESTLHGSCMAIEVW